MSNIKKRNFEMTLQWQIAFKRRPKRKYQHFFLKLKSIAKSYSESCTAWYERDIRKEKEI